MPGSPTSTTPRPGRAPASSAIASSAARRRHRREAVGDQVLGEERPRRRVVLDHQDRGHRPPEAHRHRPASRPSLRRAPVGARVMEARGARRAGSPPSARAIRALGAGISTARRAREDVTRAHAGRRAGRPPGTRPRPGRRGSAAARPRGSGSTTRSTRPSRSRKAQPIRARRTPCGRRRSGSSQSASSRGGPGCRAGRRAGASGRSARWQRAAERAAVARSARAAAGSSRSMRRRPTRRPWHGRPSRRARGCAGRRPEVSWHESCLGLRSHDGGTSPPGVYSSDSLLGWR